MSYWHKVRIFKSLGPVSGIIAAGLLTLGPSLAIASGGGESSGGGDHTSAGESDDAPATGPFFFKLDALLAPVVEKRRIKRYAEIVVTLEVAEKEHERLVNKHAAVLRDRFLRDLQFQAGMRGDGDPALDLKRIKARFKVLATRVVGEGVVLDVLIDSAIDHGG